MRHPLFWGTVLGLSAGMWLVPRFWPSYPFKPA